MMRMPPTPIPDGHGIATIKLSLFGTAAPIVTTFGYLNASGTTVGANCTAIRNAWIANFTLAKTCHHYHFVGVHCLENVGGLEVAADVVEDSVGTLNAEEVSPAVTACVTKHTAHVGRKFRGRMYLPAAYLAEANVDAGGTIDNATITSLQTAADGLLASLTADDLPMSLLHRDLSSPSAVTSLLVRHSVRTQRRRQTLS